jgi:hypothetical protein
MDHNAMLQEAENLLKIGHFEEAFELFMALESGTYDATYLRPCQMALANQLKQLQLTELSEALEKEVSSAALSDKDRKRMTRQICTEKGDAIRALQDQCNLMGGAAMTDKRSSSQSKAKVKPSRMQLKAVSKRI